MIRRSLLVAVAATVVAVLGAPSAFATPTDDPGVGQVDSGAQQDTPAQQPVDQDPQPDPVKPDPVAPDPVTPDPVQPDPVVTPEPDPVVTPDPIVTPTTGQVGVPPETSSPTTSAPSSTTAPTSSPTPTDTTAPPSDPTAAPTTSITNIKVDVDIDDHSDHSIRYDYTSNSTFTVEGDPYSNTYVYRDVDGLTYRGRDLDGIDFDTQADAQRVFDAAAGDVYWLDGDGDGVACEWNTGEFTKDVALQHGVRRGGQVAVLPYGSVDTGGH